MIKYILHFVQYYIIYRLNSGNFGIFLPNESILILKSSVCRAFEIIRDDIKIITFPWGFKVENPCFNFCVGVYVGGHLATNFLHKSKDLFIFCRFNVSFWQYPTWKLDYFIWKEMSLRWPWDPSVLRLSDYQKC